MTAPTPCRNRRWPFVLAACLCLFLSGFADAALRVRVLSAPPAAVIALRALAADIEWLPADAAEADLSLAWQADVYARAVSQAPMVPVLVLAQGKGLTLRPQDAAIFWGPDLAQQVQLARQIWPGLQRVGILHRAGQRVDILALQQAAGVTVLARAVEAPLDARTVAELAQRVDMLVASNDEVLFNRDNAKLILLTAYRHQRAWIGPTPAFVTAGAVATRAVSKQSLLTAIVDKVRHWQQEHRLGGNQELVADEVVCNAQVARSLQLSLAGVPMCQPGRKP